MELLKLSKDISCVYTDWEMYYLHPASTHLHPILPSELPVFFTA